MMIYMTGERDTLKDLKQKVGYLGTFEQYEREFARVNGKVLLATPYYKNTLPPYMPYYVTEEAFNTEDPMMDQRAKEIMTYSLQERKLLRKFQEEGVLDIEMYVIMHEIMKGYHQYAQSDTPASAPAKSAVKSTVGSDFKTKLKAAKVIGGTMKYGSMQLEYILNQYNVVDDLYKTMFAIDELKDYLASIEQERGHAANILKKSIKKQILDLSKQLQKLILRKVETFKGKYFTKGEYRKIKSYVRKQVSGGVKQGFLKSGRFNTLSITHFNQLGMVSLRSFLRSMGNVFHETSTVIEGKPDKIKAPLGISSAAKNSKNLKLFYLRKAASYTFKYLPYVGVGLQTYDTYVETGDEKKAFATFAAGTTVVAVSSAAVTAAGGTAAVGGMAVSAMSVVAGGEVALGSSLLIGSCLTGWGLFIVGTVAITYVGYQATKYLEGVIYENIK